jgi:hypothetical protein
VHVLISSGDSSVLLSLPSSLLRSSLVHVLIESGSGDGTSRETSAIGESLLLLQANSP